MKKKLVRILVIGLIITLIGGSLVYAKTLEEILGGKEPTLELVTEKKAEIVDYSKKTFKDIKGTEWFMDSASKLIGMGAVNGYKDGTFKPGNPITTAEFTKLLLATFGYKQELDSTVWYKNYVEKAKALGVIEANDNYSYTNGMKRKDMAKMICKMLGIKPGKAAAQIFSDTYGVDTSYIDKAFSEYLIRGYLSKGVRTFKPLQTATRAEVCEMIVRALEYKKNPEQYRKEKNAFYLEQEKKQNLKDGLLLDSSSELTTEDIVRLNKYIYNQQLSFKPPKSAFLNNKKTIEFFGIDKVKSFVAKAKGYEETVANLDYRTLNDSFVQNMLKYVNPKSTYTEKGKEISAEEHYRNFMEIVKSAKYVQQTKFYSDPVMVYITDDDSIRVRGMIKYIITSLADNKYLEDGEELNKWLVRDIEIELNKVAGSNEPTYTDIIFLSKPRAMGG
ncbi:MAG: S-layer homology domain-containing protein [Clostridia bacterium]|nr:S-layer homology domain-containing protein [Clostridia bacterium]